MTAAARPVALFTLLGLGTGALAAKIILGGGMESSYIAAGLVFGLVFGLVLWLRGMVGPVGAAIYVLAAGLAYAVAFFAAIQLVDPMHGLLGGGDDPALVASGVIAGALGGGLLTAVTRLLVPIRRWPLLLGVGALLGGLLPLGTDGDAPGVFAFYMLWQGGYAACLGFVLPRIETL